MSTVEHRCVLFLGVTRGTVLCSIGKKIPVGAASQLFAGLFRTSAGRD